MKEQEVRPRPVSDATVEVPGSKSLTHRHCIAAALSAGTCVIRNGLESEDISLTLGALEKFGAAVSREVRTLRITGVGGRPRSSDEPIFLGNSGTSMRLLMGVAALCPGETILTGTDRMKERPVQELIEALKQAGAKAESIPGTGCPPVSIRSGPAPGERCKSTAPGAVSFSPRFS